LISCSLPAESVSFPTRSIAESRSSERRSAGRGTAVDKETVVDSKAASLPPIRSPPNLLRISSANMRDRASEAQTAPNWDFIGSTVKKALRKLV
jgi:hypothetical protein